MPLSVTQKSSAPSIVIPSLRNPEKYLAAESNPRSSLAQIGNSPNSISGKKYKKKPSQHPSSIHKLRQQNS